MARKARRVSMYTLMVLLLAAIVVMVILSIISYDRATSADAQAQVLRNLSSRVHSRGAQVELFLQKQLSVLEGSALSFAGDAPAGENGAARLEAQRQALGLYSLCYMNAEGQALGSDGKTFDLSASPCAQRALAGFLHGEAYAAFMEDWGADGRAEGHARAPEILPLPGKLIMAARRVGGAWFVIVRPESIEGERWEAVCRVGSYRLEMNGEVLRAELEQQSLEDRIELELERVGEVRAVYEFPQARVEIYHELGVDIAVIYAQADERLGADARFCIGDAAAGISMRGYVKGDEWVYCCILTEAEAARLADGEAPRVENAADGARALMSPDGMFGGA